MHGENSNIWDKYRSLRTYAVWAGERAFAFAKRINHCLVFAQNRGFCAKRASAEFSKQWSPTVLLHEVSKRLRPAFAVTEGDAASTPPERTMPQKSKAGYARLA